MEWIFMIGFAVCCVMIAIGTKLGTPPGPRRENNRIPATIQCEGSKEQILDAVANALTNSEVCGNLWRINERIDANGRLQAICDIPLGTGSVRHTLLLNMVVAPTIYGNCSVEWTFIPLAPHGYQAAGLYLLENEMYVNTSMRIRAALLDVERFSGQRNENWIQAGGSARPEQTGNAGRDDDTDDDSIGTAAPIVLPPREVANLSAPAAITLPPEVDESSASSADSYPIEIAGTSAPVAVPSASSSIDVAGYTTPRAAPSLLDVEGYTSHAVTPSQLDVSAPVNAASPAGGGSPATTCPGCGKDWDPSFPFCIYCSYRPS